MSMLLDMAKAKISLIAIQVTDVRKDKNQPNSKAAEQNIDNHHK